MSSKPPTGAKDLAGMPLPITPTLRRRFQEAKARDGRSYKALAAAIGGTVKGPTIHEIIEGPAQTSVLVARLSEVLSVDYIDTLPIDDEMKEALRLVEAARRAGASAALLDNMKVYTRGLATAQPPSAPTTPVRPGNPKPRGST